MESLKLTLSDGGAVTGLINLPPRNRASSRHLPLLVCLHGGTYSSSYFNVQGHSVRDMSDALGVPVAAIDRAGYGGSSDFNDGGVVPDHTSYQEEEGKWLHRQVLPALWESYAKPHQLSCLVLLSHSIATPPTIVAIAESCKEAAKEQVPKYRIGGLALSGWGFTPPPDTGEVQDAIAAAPAPARIAFPAEQKGTLMLGRKDEAFCDPQVYALNDAIGTDSAFDELDHGRKRWFKVAPSYTKEIDVPVLYALAEHDLLWPPAKQEPHVFAASFPNSPKVEGGIMRKAPHCIELSYQGKAWYAKIFGFAMECAEAVGQTL